MGKLRNSGNGEKLERIYYCPWAGKFRRKVVRGAEKKIGRDREEVHLHEAFCDVIINCE
jgi:hypothetical protein